jgi:hypothetical protein
MRISLPPYQLAIDPEPFSFSVFRGSEPVISLSAMPEPALDIRQEGPTIWVNFRQAALKISIDGQTLDVQWRSSEPVRNSFPLQGYWYGQGELLHQLWPLNRGMLAESELITTDNGETGLICMQSPVWLSSRGAAVLALSPVKVGINQPPASYPRYGWDLGAQQGPYDHRPFRDPDRQGDGLLTLSGKDLHYQILLAEDLTGVYRTLCSRWQHPEQIPPEELFTLPTWTTWARYKTAIDQETVLKFADEIREHQFPYGVMEIDDRWQVFYGDLGFDPARFPQPKEMVRRLHDQGFKVTAWVIPFLDPKSAAFAEGASRGYLVKTAAGEPYLVRWWQGNGGLLDTTNPAALEWFRQRLVALQDQTGLDGFKFDAGEARFVPTDAVLASHPASRNEYTRCYVDFVARNFSLTEVRSAWMNQDAPIFFRQWDKTTSWTLANGLHSVLTGILTLSITGYPFILPDMIGGNAYFGDKADSELMIRWTQLNALLPAVQFSLAPWDYGALCNDLCLEFTRLHVQYAPLFIRLAKEAAQTHEPIIRPVFWTAPQDERALQCDDEFLVGNDLLVAPVVKPGCIQRDIYLPPGLWEDANTGKIIAGSQVIQNYPAPLKILPYFFRK